MVICSPGASGGRRRRQRVFEVRLRELLAAATEAAGVSVISGVTPHTVGCIRVTQGRQRAQPCSEHFPLRNVESAKRRRVPRFDVGRCEPHWRLRGLEGRRLFSSWKTATGRTHELTVREVLEHSRVR
jgi:hypothetical protein